VSLRNAVLFVAALACLSATAFVAQRFVFGREVGDDLVVSSAAPRYATAPTPAAQAAPETASRRQASGVPLVDAAWAARTARAAGIPEPALLAYARATLMAPSGCGVGWTTLAGLGWVESQHGTIGGRTIGADGRSSTPILGPALDGVGKVAAIRATPQSTTWHGDPEWDHAVGPLQFIPSTWETWSSDGDGDGVADPNDLDDAAYAAVRYLCADGYDLSTGPGWSAAVFAYNHARVYVDAVYAAASAYADRTS
jgi:membrane-bound lytic murein transglycosylase B